MLPVTSPPIFDGHNDVLLRLWMKKNTDAARDFIDGDGLGHIDLPRLRAGGMVGGLFAIFVPPDHGLPDDDDDPNPPIAGAMPQQAAARTTDAMFDLRNAIVAAANGTVRVCVTAAEIRSAIADNAIALVTHIEGAEAIRPDLANLQGYVDRGLRSIGPVWSRPNAFGSGVPFRFPSSPDTGPGLTEAGKALVRECNRLHILLDLSHLNEKGFWDVVRLSNAPLVASHSNAHALANHSRNLTDDQLAAIGKSGGIAGLNFATAFLREDGRWKGNVEPAVLIRHLEHMISVAGEESVGIGSDFDGCSVPNFINDASGLPNLVEAMREVGFGAALIEKITCGNWLRVLEKTWGA